MNGYSKLNTSDDGCGGNLGGASVALACSSDNVAGSSLSMKINGTSSSGDSDSLCDSLDRSINGAILETEMLPNGSTEPTSPVTDPDELALLEKLQQANQMLESDSRSLQSLSSQRSRRLSPSSADHGLGNHSRRGSMSSVLSGVSSGSVNCSSQYDDNNQENLWTAWGRIINEWDSSSKKRNSDIKELVHRGIPQPFRGIAWQLLCGVDHDCPDKRNYSEFLKMTSPFEKTIGRDITRTFPGHDLFKDKDGIGQESLFNVMKAYSLYDREVGYCQGSAFIAGLLLMHMPEEEAFAVLARIMHSYGLRELFKPSMAELGLRMFQLECMIRELLPELYNHFQAQGIATSMFASSWFLTLFITVLPLPIACHVFDVFLYEGLEVIFRVGISILQLNLEDLLALDMEEMIKFLQKDLALRLECEPEILMMTALQVKYNARKLKKVEKEYTVMKTKELEEQVELRRLRTENKLLQQRIDNLEKETETLADRLIQDQVKCAQQEEQICILRQKVASKLDDADLNTSPEQALTTLSPPDSIGSTLVAKMSRPLSLFPTPWFGTKDKSRRFEQLQKELDDAAEALLRTRSRLNQLENENDSLRKQQEHATSPEDVEALHQELIICKLREAESNMASKQLQNELFEIERLWQKCRDRTVSPSQQLVNDAMMAAQLKEADLTSQVADLRQRLLIAEQQGSVSERRAERLAQANEALKERLTSLEAENSLSRQKLEVQMEARQRLEMTIQDLQTKNEELVQGFRRQQSNSIDNNHSDVSVPKSEEQEGRGSDPVTPCKQNHHLNNNISSCHPDFANVDSVGSVLSPCHYRSPLSVTNNADLTPTNERHDENVLLDCVSQHHFSGDRLARIDSVKLCAGTT